MSSFDDTSFDAAIVQVKDVEFTAKNSGYYLVWVNGIKISQHTAEREALEKATNLVNATDIVKVTHDYEVSIELKGVTLGPIVNDISITLPTDSLQISEPMSTITVTTPGFQVTPDQFTFTDQLDVTENTIRTSLPITVTGINTPVAISVSGSTGLYDINGSGVFTNSPGTVNNGDTVRTQHLSTTNSNQRDTIVTIGTVSDTFTSTTISVATDVVIAFSDLTSAPREGWSVADSGRGAAVTIWGRGFGTPGVRGSDYVTVGGVDLNADTDYADTWCLRSNPIPWLDSICFHLNNSIPTGNTTISVTVGGVESNTVPFAVNASGDIHFVDINGSGADVGTFEDPWLIPGTDFVNGTSGGDVTYFRGGTYDQAYNGGGSRAVIRNNFNNTGTAAAPIAYVGYPGEVAFIDSDTNGGSGSLHTCIDMEADYITCAKFKTKAYAVSMGVDRVGGRAVGNDCQGPLQGLSGVGNINIIQSGAVVLGNTVWGCRTQDKLDHAIYASGCQPLAPAEIAYNYAYDNQFDRGPIFSENHQDDRCRAGEYMQPNRWHSNVAEGGTGLFASRGFYQETLSYEVGDPGGVPTTYFYNNILYRCGQADFASIGVNRSDCGVFNNTCIDENSVSIVLTINMATLGDNVNAKNNIFIQAAGNSYDMVQIDGGTIDLDTNCYWNGTAAPEDVNPFITDPDVTYTANSYTPVTMGAASSAKNNGTTDVDITSTVTKDFYLKTRTGTMDIGAVNIED